MTNITFVLNFILNFLTCLFCECFLFHDCRRFNSYLNYKEEFEKLFKEVECECDTS